MPFTFSHPAIVLPLNSLFKRQLSLTGLVIGSLVPDFEYFFRMRVVSIYSHTWQGLLWFDLPLGVMLLIIYEFWIKNPLIEHLPTGLNKRFFIFRGFQAYYSLQYFFIIVISVALGAASHLLWDGFTHPGGAFVQQYGFLRRIVHIQGYRLYVFSCLQYASAATGALLILIVCFSLPKGKLTQAKSIAGFWLQVILVTIVVTAIKLATGLPLHQYGNVIVTVIDGGLLGLIIASLLA